MGKPVTVAQAIRRGKLLTTGGTLKGILLALPLPFIAMVVTHTDLGKASAYAIIAMIAGILLGNIFTAFSATKWRIWAFTHVDDIEELQKAALAENLIYFDNRRRKPWVIESNADRKKIDDIQKRLDGLLQHSNREFTDDPALLAESRIYKSTSRIILTAIGIAVPFTIMAAMMVHQVLYGPAGLVLVVSWGAAY